MTLILIIILLKSKHLHSHPAYVSVTGFPHIPSVSSDGLRLVARDSVMTPTNVSESDPSCSLTCLSIIAATILRSSPITVFHLSWKGFGEMMLL